MNRFRENYGTTFYSKYYCVNYVFIGRKHSHVLLLIEMFDLQLKLDLKIMNLK